MAAYKSIIVSGKPGSGKTTLARMIAEDAEFGLRLIQAGEFFRRKAAELGLDLDTFYDKADTEKMDREVDMRIKGLVEAGGVVADCRVPLADRSAALRVFVHAPVALRAERLIRGGRQDYVGHPMEEVVRRLRRREGQERERYQEYYGIDLADPKLFDEHLDSSKMDPDEEKRRVKDKYRGTAV